MNVREADRVQDDLPSSDSFMVPEDMVIVDADLRAREEAVRANARVAEQEQAGDGQAPEISGESDLVAGVTGEESRMSAPVLQTYSERDTVRLLICTKEASVFEPGSYWQRRLLELSGLFAEIHVIVLTEKSGGETQKVERLSESVWVYSTASSGPLFTAYDAYRVACEQLTFLGGFRADLVIAEDPFESGIAAHFIAKKFNRPLQVHLFQDFFDPEWKARDPHSGIRLLLARFLFKHGPDVRTQSENIRQSILGLYPSLEANVEVLPLYHDLKGWREIAPEFDLKERYPRFKFVILHISSMRPKSHTSEVIAGVLPLLNLYPTIGLVIVGSGPLRGAIEKQVTESGMAGRIVFEPEQANVISHMKSAHVLVHLSEDAEEDVTVLEAASVRLPIIGLNMGMAGTLFKNGESAFLCESVDPVAVSRYLRMFLNDNSARLQLAVRAEEVVFERVEQDYEAYLRAYRTSIERSL